MGEFLQTLFVGLRLGSVYALIALGYTMVYGIIRLINFAHGDFIMVGGYTLFLTVPLMTAAGLPAWAAASTRPACSQSRLTHPTSAWAKIRSLEEK